SNLGLRVEHRVVSLALVARIRPPPSRLSEIDVAGQLANDHDVESRYHFRLQARCADQFRKQQRRTQVREQSEFLADAQYALLRPLQPGQRVLPGPADPTPQYTDPPASHLA